MKIVQSFWSLPYGASSVDDLLNKLKGQWVHSKYNLMCWALSSLKFKEFYADVELVTDDLGKELLVDALKLPYTKINTSLNNLKCPFPEHLWVYGKLYTYSIQDEPFIHADGDVVIWRRFPKRIENSDLLAQSLDKDVPIYELIMNEILREFDFIPQEFERSPPYLASNAGIIGGKNLTFYKELFELSSKFLLLNENKIKSVNSGLLFAIFEQYYFYILANKRGLAIEHLFKDVALKSFKTLGFHEIPHFSSYIHPITSYKSKHAICRQIECLLRYEYPEYHSRIIELFSKSSLKNNIVEDMNLSKTLFDFESHFDRMTKILRSTKKEDIYDLKFILSSHVDTYESENSGEFFLKFIDPVDYQTKSIPLNGIDVSLIYLQKATSVNDIILDLNESSNWSDKKKLKIKKMLFKSLSSYMLYFCALEIHGAS